MQFSVFVLCGAKYEVDDERRSLLLSQPLLQYKF